MKKVSKPNSNPDERSLKTRLIVIGVLFLLFAGALLSRLFYLQILQHDQLLARSERQHYGDETVQYGRGKIFDRNMNVLAANVELESVYVNPHEVADPQRVAKNLSAVLGKDFDRILKLITSQKGFVWIQRKALPEAVNALKRENLQGVEFIVEHKRFYPKRKLASHSLGFVGMDNQGLAGAEHLHDSMLKGASVELAMEIDARGRRIRFPHPAGQNEFQSLDVALTIDEVVQFFTEYELGKAVAKRQAIQGFAIVMNPKTGEIYSIANAPAFNPNSYSKYSKETWKNQAIAGSFEPGSIFKPVLAAAAIDSGVAAPNEIIYCENGTYRLGTRIFREASGHSFGWLSLKDVIAKSSNIGTIKIAEKLGRKTFYRYMKRFGFGEKLGIDLPGEGRGKLRPLREWSRLSYAPLSFGQEISVTPLQMISAISAMANGGNLMKPYITKAAFRHGEEINKTEPQIIRRAVAPETGRKMVDILRRAVNQGTGGNAAIEGFDVAGKTGTAQKFDPLAGAYSDQYYMASFVGFVPAYSPRLAILVMIDSPRGTHYGGSVAAPVFREIAKQTLRYMNIPSRKERVLILDRA